MNDPKWITEIRQRAAKATPGAWHKTGCAQLQPPHEVATRYTIMAPDIRGHRAFMVIVDGTCETGVVTEEDAEFIANAREDIPTLLAYIAELREAAGAVVECDKHDDGCNDCPLPGTLGCIRAVTPPSALCDLLDREMPPEVEG